MPSAAAVAKSVDARWRKRLEKRADALEREASGLGPRGAAWLSPRARELYFAADELRVLAA